MDERLLEDGLNALRTRKFAGERQGDIRLISLRQLSREQLVRVSAIVSSVAAEVGVPAEVSGIGFGCTTLVISVKTARQDEESRKQIEMLFAGFVATAAQLRDCDIQIIIRNTDGHRQDLRNTRSETEEHLMDLLPIAQAIAAAVSIVRNLPGAIDTAKKVRFDLDKTAEVTSLGLSGTVDDSDPLTVLLDGLTSEVRQLSTDFIKKSQSWNVPERQDHQRRVAAKMIDLLSVGKPILARRMPNYDLLVEFFNGVVRQEDKPA